MTFNYSLRRIFYICIDIQALLLAIYWSFDIILYSTFLKFDQLFEFNFDFVSKINAPEKLSERGTHSSTSHQTLADRH